MRANDEYLRKGAGPRCSKLGVPMESKEGPIPKLLLEVQLDLVSVHLAYF